MKLFRFKELTMMLLLCVAVSGDAKDIMHRHRHEHSSFTEDMEMLKVEHQNEMQTLRHEIAELRKEMLARCGHGLRHRSTTDEGNEKHTLEWARKAVHKLQLEVHGAADKMNASGILLQLHSMHNQMKRIIAESANIMKLGRVNEARLDKIDNIVERLKYDKKNQDLVLEEFRQQMSSIATEMKNKIEAHEEEVNDVMDPKVAHQTQLLEKNHKSRHDKMIHMQISRLSHAQDQLDTSQQKMETQLLDQKRRLERLEEPNLNLITAKIDLLELETKVFSDRLNNNTRAISDFEKVHGSMLELREDLEAVENKMDKTIPEFRKEISKLDVCQAQMNAHFSYVKENQENLRQSVKAIAVSVSNTQDRAEEDRDQLKKIRKAVEELTTQTKKHYYRLNDHILKSEANQVVPEANLTETISLPQLMGEVKELQPVQREYEDLVAQLPKDCSSISGPAGSYIIHPGHDTVDAWCVNGTTLVQRRFNGSVDFNRKFAEYVRGFGDPTSEYWLGLETLHQLTADNCSAMRIDMTDIYETSWYAEYENFYVGSADTGFVLVVDGFRGNASDSFEYHNRMEFSAIDRDRDISNTHCAANYEGGWWYSHCQHVNINGKYTLGLTWFDSIHNEWIAISTTEVRVFRRPGCI